MASAAVQRIIDFFKSPFSQSSAVGASVNPIQNTEQQNIEGSKGIGKFLIKTGIVIFVAAGIIGAVISKVKR